MYVCLRDGCYLLRRGQEGWKDGGQPPPGTGGGYLRAPCPGARYYAD